MQFRISSFSTTASIALVVLLFGALGGMVFFYVFYNGPVEVTTWQPTQPVAYSHKLHAGTNKIPCQYCHSGARRGEAAQVPSAQKCMNCHSVAIKPESPIFKPIADAVNSQKAVEWVRVYRLPDHVWFNHKRHVAKDIACQTCHGPIETMDVVAKVNDFKMGFCLSCHQEKGAPTDCWTCHT